MATFEAQVEGLTSLSIDGSSAPTQTELTQFLTDGAVEVINAMPQRLKYLCATKDTFTSTAFGSESEVPTSGEILSVTRVSEPCRQIPAELAGRASDSSAFASSHMETATATDPVWYIYNGKVNALPASGACEYLEVNRPSVAYTHSSMATSLASFPLEYEYLVPLYASIKSLQNAMGNMNTLAAIDTTSLGAITTELNKADDIINTAQGKVDAFYTSIGDIDDTTELWDNTNKRFTVVRDALVYAGNLIDNNKPDAAYDVAQNLLDVNAALDGMQAHLADGEAILTSDPTSGDIATALTAMKNAIEAAENRIDKMEGADESVFGDEDTFLTASSQLTRVKDALDNAEKIIDDGANSPTGQAAGDAATYLYTDEDTELLQGTLSIAASEIQRAQAHISEWNAIGDMRVKEINASLSEAQAYAGEIQARLSYATAYQQASTARGQEGQSRIAQANVTLSVAQQELARANAAIAEINTLMGSYRLELEGVAPYLQAASGYISQAQGYISETNTRMQREEQKYKWLQSEQSKLQSDYDRGLQLLSGRLQSSPRG